MSGAPASHSGLVLIHDSVAIRDGGVWGHNKNNDAGQVGSRSMHHKLSGQGIVLAKGRVQANDKMLSMRQHACTIINTFQDSQILSALLAAWVRAGADTGTALLGPVGGGGGGQGKGETVCVWKFDDNGSQVKHDCSVTAIP